MTAITRRRIAAAAGVLTLSGLLGVTVAVPSTWQEGKTAMTQQATPNKYAGIKLASVPAPWDSVQLTSVQRAVPPPFEDS